MAKRHALRSKADTIRCSRREVAVSSRLIVVLWRILKGGPLAVALAIFRVVPPYDVIVTVLFLRAHTPHPEIFERFLASLIASLAQASAPPIQGFAKQSEPGRRSSAACAQADAAQDVDRTANRGAQNRSGHGSP